MRRARGNGRDTVSLDNIRHDIDQLQAHLAGLAVDVKDVAAHKAMDAADYMTDRIEELQDAGVESLHQVEKQIKARPGQSIAVAFAAGVLASLLFRKS